MAKDKEKKKKRKQKSQAKKGKKSKFTAETADRHDLYQRSVQASDTEIEILDNLFQGDFGEKALTMREDFCGTALLCATWVKSAVGRTATGVDLDESTLAWGKERNIEPLGVDKNRVTLLQEDVRKERPGKFQVINALNFSYSVFRTREDLMAYFKQVLGSLEDKGIFLLDAYGGWESQEPMLEPREIVGGFTYIWDQHSFDPITHEVVNHIHFKFKDGTRLDKAFTYEWRYWTLPELQELLKEAGFSHVRVYWDLAAEEDEEDYQPTKSAENQPGWLAYLVARK